MTLQFIGYAAVLLMGGLLGLVGAGGSILTVPILVYLLQVPPLNATSDSLALVGATAAVGAWHYLRQRQLDLRAALTFVPASLIAAYATRAWLLPALPDAFTLAGRDIGKDAFIMLLLAALMLASARFMLKPHACENGIIAPRFTGAPRLAMLVLSSIFIGVLTGLVGAGGGFLIVPALLCLFGLTMQNAVGTSLFVIAMNAFVGFIGSLNAGFSADWPFLAALLALMLLGMALGTRFNAHCNERRLRRLFGAFTLIVAVGMIVHQTLV